jgi:hypothetical protein
MDNKCDKDGWVIPPTMNLRDEAWKTGSPVTGCSNLQCRNCGRTVLSFNRVLLRERPPTLSKAYDLNELNQYLSKGPTADNFRTYICGCRSFPAGRERDCFELQDEVDTPWACAGHPSSPGVAGPETRQR